eukprot:CAMPEP_0198278180 /NCGR_PEP_ID=MMETSP1447-20131203/66243_1 /TAXON_ID=420782 /ORGANISM="Chaetoceros dichaeta, Strain CCMP1751" /LENGTH=1231 /DNA_ID=CAMNT_0043973249 /DNA_START=148 /DNA_END=3843 /DNA_ORIENTATION=+
MSGNDDSFLTNPPHHPNTSPHTSQSDYVASLVIDEPRYNDRESHEKMISGLIREIICNDDVTRICYSPDGTQVFVSTYNNTATAYDITTGTVLHEFKYDCRVYAIAYSPNGSQLAVGLDKYDGIGAFVYDAVTYIQLHAIERDDRVSAICYSLDSHEMAVGGFDSSTTIYEATSGVILHDFNQDRNIRAVGFSPNGEQIAIGTSTKYIYIFNNANCWELIHTIGCEGKISTLAYSPDSSRIACGGSDMKVVIYDAVSATVLLELKRGGYVSSIAYSPNGSQIAVSADDSKVIIYDSTMGAVLHEFPAEIRSVAYSPDSTQICMGGSNKKISWYNTATRTVLREFPRDLRVLTISYSPDSKQIAVGGVDNAVIIYDALTDNVLHTLKRNNAIFTIAYSPDSRQLAVGGKDCTVSIYDALSGEIIRTYERESWIRTIAYSPDGKQFAFAGSDSKIDFFDSVSGTSLPSIDRPGGGVLALIYSPDNTQIAIGGIDKKVNIYDRMTRAFLHQVSYQGKVWYLAYSPDGSQMAVGGEHNVTVCDSPTGATLHKIALDGSVRSLAYSPDGENITVGTSTKMMNIYNTSNWELFCSPILFHAAVLGVSFLPHISLNHLDRKAYILAVAVGNFSIIMRIHANTRSPVEYLLKNDDDEILLNYLSVYKTATFWRNENGKTLLAAALEEDRSELVTGLVEYCNKYELIHNSSEQLMALMDYLQQRYDLQSLHKIIESKCYREYTSSVLLMNMVDALHTLTEKKSVDSVVKALEAGEEKAIPGFVYQKDGLQSPPKQNASSTSWFSFLNMFSNIQKFPTKSSNSPSDFHLWYETDLNRRVNLKTLRVLLPNLGNFNSLKILIKMESLQPFNTESLGTVINCQWNKWAKNRFFFQFYAYILWLILLTLLWEVTNKAHISGDVTAGRQWTEIFLTALVTIGLLYFTYIEYLQYSVLDRDAYWKDGWNLTQNTARLLSAVFIILEYSNVSRAVVAHFAALSLLCNTAGILFFLRGFDKVGWIIHALISIMRDMIPFLLVMFVILLMFALTFWVLHDTAYVCDSDMECVDQSFNNIGRSLETIFFAGVFGDFDRDVLEETYQEVSAKILLAVLLVITSVISLNALIAFMGNTFARVLCQKTAVLTRTKAQIILEMYCQMSTKKRKQIEEENQWTYIIVPKATLDTINKSTNQNHDLLKIQAEMTELKVELAKTKGELKAEIITEFRFELNNTVEKIAMMLAKKDSQ